MPSINMKHHKRKRDPKIQRRLRAVQNTGIAVPAFLRIPNHGDLLLFGLIEHMGWANIRTYPATVAFLLVDDWRHNILRYVA
jgi:hypothetical protein